jgi:hypothetical protein
MMTEEKVVGCCEGSWTMMMAAVAASSHLGSPSQRHPLTITKHMNRFEFCQFYKAVRKIARLFSSVSYLINMEIDCMVFFQRNIGFFVFC